MLHEPRGQSCTENRRAVQSSIALAGFALAPAQAVSETSMVTPGNPILWPLKRVNALRRWLLNQLWQAELRVRGVELEAQTLFNGRPYVVRHSGSRIQLGEQVCCNSSLRSNPLGNARPVTLRTLRPGAEIILDRFVGVSGCSICAAASIRIGEGTFVGADAMIFDNDFHSPEGEFRWGDAAPDNPKPIKIGRGVFIGARALVLKGVTIGDRAVIGAGAVVTKDVPTQHIAVGNPARLLSAQNPA
jgi:carbonic anhydrase/acetyltransferase-like protein (isoleucine patch superfamily)